MIAGMLTESNIIGYPVGFPYNEVNRAVNAFTMGAREVNPDAEVQVVYVNTWFDPAIEQQAAEALVNAGADVLAHEVGAQVYATVAAQNGGHVIGYTNDWSQIEPEAWASSFLYDWGTYYVDQVGDMIDGTWEPAITYGGLEDGFITFAPYGPDVTDEMLADGRGAQAEHHRRQLRHVRRPDRGQRGQRRHRRGRDHPVRRADRLLPVARRGRHRGDPRLT